MGLELRVVWLDVSANLASGVMPVYLLPRQPAHANSSPLASHQLARVGRYYVPQSTLLSDKQSWVLTDSEDWVRIPVHAYSTNEYAVAAVLGLGVQLGMLAVDGFVRKVGEPVLEAVLVLGSDCPPLAREGGSPYFRCFVGLALRVRDK